VAKQKEAAIPARAVQNLRDQVTDQIEGNFILEAEGMSALRRSLDGLAELADPNIPVAQRIQALERWRARVSGMNPKDGSPAAAATRRTLDIYDAWMNDMFNKDMIQGDASAVQAWQNARGAWRSYKERFDSDRVIRDLAQKETTPEQMSAWLFNANAVGAKREAGQVVQRLNDIVGRDSPQMAGLRAEVVLDVAQPLFDDVPNIQAFVRKYETFLANNPTLRRNLFPDEYGTDLDDLYRFAKAIAKRPGTRVEDLKPQDIWGRVGNLLNRFIVGHGLAKGAARLQVTGGLGSFLRYQTSGRVARTNILREYLGTDPKQALIPMPTAIGGALGRAEDRPWDRAPIEEEEAP
jgi:hypothetical protein